MAFNVRLINDFLCQAELVEALIVTLRQVQGRIKNIFVS